MFREVVLKFMGVKDQPARATPRRWNQCLGEYCKEIHLLECRRYFSSEEILRRVCSTCPQ